MYYKYACECEKRSDQLLMFSLSFNIYNIILHPYIIHISILHMYSEIVNKLRILILKQSCWRFEQATDDEYFTFIYLDLIYYSLYIVLLIGRAWL